MGEINWGPVRQWFSGVVTSLTLLYVLLKEIVWAWLTRPNIMLSFDISPEYPGYKDQGNTRFPGEPTLIPGGSRWVRLQVQSEHRGRFGIRRRFAKNCRAYLVGVRVIGESGTLLDEMRNDVRLLGWKHGNYPPECRDLLPGVVHQIDLAFTFDGDPQPRLFYAVHPRYGGTRCGRYVFTVHVTSENADPKGIELTLDWNGSRESLIPHSSRPIPLT
jgi:hypothetical protein